MESIRIGIPGVGPGARRWAALVIALLLSLAAALSAPTAGWSDSAPADPADPANPPTVAADALPTVQINGVVWSQATVGNTVYAGGSFTTARPAGTSSGGAGSVTRNNLVAYDIRTGAMTSFAPSFNGQIRAVAVSPDQSRIYVGGDFTTVNGVARSRVAAFDATTGALVSGFAPQVNGSVTAIAATNATVYVGGSFGGVGNQTRSNLAAFSRAGALLGWAPVTSGGFVWAMAVDPAGAKVAVGGSFTALNGSSNPGYGLGMVDATTGTNLPFAMNNYVRNATVDGAITTLASDGTHVYGGGYTFGRAGGTFEGFFSARWDGGTVEWINDCHGDSYSVFPQGSVVYAASHTHYCENIDGIRQGAGFVGDYPYYRGVAMGKAATRTTTWEPDQRRYYDFSGQPASAILTWYPTINAGTYTGQSQGPWSVTGNSQYIAMGGEFTRVNGQNQQGLVRFAVPSIAPNDRGPTLFNATYPLNVRSTEAGKVRIAWSTNEDMDNDNLTYRLYRDTQTAAGLIHTRTARAFWWNHYGMGFTDTGVTPGSTHQYRVVVTDPFGNVANSPWTTVTVPASGTDSPYVDAVEQSEPTHWWRLGEDGTTADSAGARPLTTTAGVVPDVSGAIQSDPENRAIRLPGLTTARAYTTVQDWPPDAFTLEGWFRTSTGGGKILGWGNRNDRDSSKADRHLYLDDAGRVHFGVKPDATRQVVSSPTAYADGDWHHVAASLAPTGMRLYVDGELVGQRTDVRTAEHLSIGYWRIGADTLTSWPSAPTNTAFAGDLDELAVYKRALSATEVATHYAAGTGAATPNQPPTASFTASVANLTASFTSTSSDPDGTISTHAWDFGDGTTGTGASPSHTYAAAGQYTVKLTVTDDDGATASTTRQVTVSAPPEGPAPLAADAFGRTVTDGWGSADLGGVWVRSGTASNYSVSGGLGRIRMSSPGGGPGAALDAVSSTDADVRVRLGADKAATGGGIYLTVQPRRVSAADRYYADVRLQATGAVSLILGRAVAGAETTLQSRTVTGVTATAGQLLQVRVQATGTAPTTFRAKVWPVGQPEPDAWTASVTDSTAALQAPGGLGLRTYLSGSATNAPVVGLFDDLDVRTTG